MTTSIEPSPADDRTPSMERLAEVAEAIAATAATSEKVRLLADFLGTLDDGRLAIAARFFSGGDVLGRRQALAVGGAALFAALRRVTGLDEEALFTIWARHADAGETVEEALRAVGHRGIGIDLVDVAETFEQMATADGATTRIRLLGDLLERCRPLEAKYVAKIVSGDMRIGLREQLVEEAIARATGSDRAAVARAHAVVDDIGDVAVLARRQRLSEARPRLFSPVRFMLASPVGDATDVVSRLGDEVWVEDKYDGIRCQLHRDDERVALFSRDLREVTEQFPDLAEDARRLRGSLILDGEVLAWRDGRALPFFALQNRLGRKRPSPRILEEVPVVFVAWDLLWHDGESLLDLPLRRRRERLEALGLGGRFGLAHVERARGVADIDALFAAARQRYNEGLIAKDPQAPYTPGRRGLAWLKLKRPLDTLDVVVIGAEYGHGRRRAVLSDVTFAVRADETGELVAIGKAYSGLTDAEIAEMTRWLEERTIALSGRYRVVVPEIVLEVAFDSVQPSSRHPSGYALRFPRIVAWRRDKSVADIDTLSRVRAIAERLAQRREQLVDGVAAANVESTAAVPSPDDASPE